jgi:diguanylate cyclase (GGDEF)-like protein/putative nucleotidyltransferase with HDIG domain
MNQLPVAALFAGGVILAAATYLLYQAYRTYLSTLLRQQRQAQQMAELHLATIEALAGAIDAKDQTAQHHIKRVQLYAVRLGEALGMPETDLQGLRTAALLHDIGKLAVPEHILAKPGPLTSEEFHKIRIHPQVGADILANVPFPYPVAPLILSHHERWDGRGYPAGLKEHDIPPGARILAIVDFYEALTSDRPYHKAMTPESAEALLQQEAGKALDPHGVKTFVAMLPALRAEFEATVSRVPSQPHADAADAGHPGPRVATVYDDIALAHREMYALYQIAQTMGTGLGVGDTMALIAPKLANLVPFSACALFLHDESTDAVQCRFATGIDSDLLERLSIRTGQGLTGWVARNRRPLVNAQPATDFDLLGGDVISALQSALVCPLVFGERLIGALAVYHIEPGFYRDDHRRLLDRVCEQAAAVVNNSIVFERTQEDSLTDPLTGLPNTRFMFLHLTRELARAERLKAEVSLLVLDLDDFKEINDNHGHHTGDRALREIAKVLRGVIRPYDICVRYAGDEFIVVLSGCGRDEAENKRTELQHAVDRLVFEPAPGVRVPLTMSAGAAVFPRDGDTYEALLARADNRMYLDKSRRKALRYEQQALEDAARAGDAGARAV